MTAFLEEKCFVQMEKGNLDMKTYRKVSKMALCLLLALLSAVYCLPQSVLAQAGQGWFGGEEETELSSLPGVDAVAEVVEKRSDSGKVFLMSDGSYAAVEYAQRIHYMDKAGNRQEYDNTLRAEGSRYAGDEPGYVNSSSDLRVKFSASSDSLSLVRVEDGPYRVSFGLVGALGQKNIGLKEIKESRQAKSNLETLSTLSKHSAGLTYRGILPDVDLEYTLSGDTVKENIVVHKRAQGYTYHFFLDLEGLYPVLKADGSVLLNCEKSGEVKFVIPAGYMSDAAGAYSEAVSYALEKSEGGYILSVTAEAGWINDKERTLPVRIDPTIVTGWYSWDWDIISDTFVSSKHPGQTYNGYNALTSYMVAGYNSYFGKARSYIRLDELPEIPASSVVVGAYLNLRQLHDVLDPNRENPYDVIFSDFEKYCGPAIFFKVRKDYIVRIFPVRVENVMQLPQVQVSTHDHRRRRYLRQLVQPDVATCLAEIAVIARHHIRG
mgnify:CR=1 FL=1